MDPKEILARLAESGTPSDAESALRLSVGLDDKFTRFENETLPFLAAGGAEIQFIFAPYGRGKTHLLLALKELSRRHNFVTAYIDCKTDQSPFVSLPATYRQIAVNMEPPYPSVLTRRSGIEGVIQSHLDQLESPIEHLKKLKEDSHLPSDFRNLVIAYGKSLITPKLTDLRSHLSILLSANAASRVTISFLYRQYSCLPRPLGKLAKRNASTWVRAVSSLPFSLGYAGSIILFDETEKTHAFHKLSWKNRLQYWANLRNLVDHLAIGSFRGCAIFFAVVEEFWELAHQQYQALSQRIERVRFNENLDHPNPRAIWVNLDELTNPGPDDSDFFNSLAAKIIDMGIEAGLGESKAKSILKKLKSLGRKDSESIDMGAVRKFVKLTANEVLTSL